ncbi:MAG: thiamine-phosphate kinase [Actinomycetota bacterium]|nr:thiamine-phosphate kinase [Actinomycetota bacterium]
MDDLRALGEFGVLQRLLARLPEPSRVHVGPGDDAAVLRIAGPIIATADLLTEGRHFDLAFSSMRDVGFKAIAVNASDVAAMGGTPVAALISLGADGSTGVESLESLYDGVADAARLFGLDVAGGDMVGSDRLIVSVALIGRAERPVLRSGARAGDALCVTGTVGGAAAGLSLLRAAGHDPRARSLIEEFPNLIERHRRGCARVREGQAASSLGARAMIDVSDGVAQDAMHIAEASGCGVVIDEALPLELGVAEVAAWLGEDPATVAIRGGDDYELLIAVESEAVEALRDAVAPTPLTRIGSFDDASRLDAAGWDHFA